MNESTSYKSFGALLIVLLLGCTGAVAQARFKIPGINDVLSGHKNMIKAPTLNDLGKFTKDYQSHLALLDRRSEKAYRKSFLKFVVLEDALLFSLCDSNEFRADMLM